MVMRRMAQTPMMQRSLLVVCRCLFALGARRPKSPTRRQKRRGIPRLVEAKGQALFLRRLVFGCVQFQFGAVGEQARLGQCLGCRLRGCIHTRRHGLRARWMGRCQCFRVNVEAWVSFVVLRLPGRSHGCKARPACQGAKCYLAFVVGDSKKYKKLEKEIQTFQLCGKIAPPHLDTLKFAELLNIIKEVRRLCMVEVPLNVHLTL